MEEVEVVILRFSLGICSPGCLHLVLESVSPRAPYLLEHRTAHPFQYKQAGIGKLTCNVLVENLLDLMLLRSLRSFNFMCGCCIVEQRFACLLTILQTAAVVVCCAGLCKLFR